MPLPTRIAVLLLSLGLNGLAFSESGARRPNDLPRPFQGAVTPADSSELLKLGERELLTSIGAMTTGDFTGDGWADLVVAEKGVNSATLWVNDQTGRFTPGPVIALAGPPLSLAAADLTGDSRLDLIAGLPSGNVAVLEGLGGGAFAPAVTLPTGGSPAYLRIGRLNADTMLDLVVSNSSATTIAVLLNQGSLVFTTTHYPAGSTPTGVAIGDFNHDGTKDLAVASGTGSAVISVLIGAGDGTFAAAVANPITGTFFPSALEAADFDGDLFDDVVVSHGITGRVALLWNNGAGALGAQEDVTLRGASNAGAELVVTDLDDNGTLDVVLTDVNGAFNRNWISFWLNLGSRTFDRSIRYWVGDGAATGGSPFPKTFLALDDIDHVGRADLIVGINTYAPASAQILVLRHRAGRLFEGLTDYQLVDGAGILAAVDFQASGKHDLLMSRGGHLWKLASDANGAFSPPADLGPGALETALDLNGDGRTDVIQTATHPLSISLCDASGNLLPTDSYASRLRLTGDFDGDGLPDVLGESAGGLLETLLNDGTGHFAAPVPANVPALGVQPIGVGDLDGDTYADLLAVRQTYVPNVASDSVTVFRGLGDGTFAPLASHALPHHPTWSGVQAPAEVLVADLDGDDELDVIVTSRFHAGLGVFHVLIGDGAGGLGPAVQHDVTREGSRLRLVDADRDGDLDAIVTAYSGDGIGYLQVFANRGNGTFSPPFRQDIQHYPGRPGDPSVVGRGVVAGDFDADGSPDVAFSYNYNEGDGIGVFLGSSSDAPTPVQISLVDATVDADGVHLAWEGASAGAAQVQRRASVAWSTLATLTPDGNGRYVFEDRDVEPGARYGYRLQFGDGAQTQYTEAIFVDIPRAAGLQLERPSPNPSLGTLRISFTLSNRAPATVEMTDVAGRRVRSVSLSSPEPGRHTLDLSRGGRLAPGLYWVRLTQGEESAVTRVVVLR